MTKQQERYIIRNFDHTSVEKLRKDFNEKFGTNYKTTAFHYHTDRLGLKKHTEHQYTALEDEFLRINSGLMTRQELTDRFNKEFGCSIKLNTIVMRCFKKGFKPLSDGRFKPGSVPWEKTKGGKEEWQKTLFGGNPHSFKKGHIPVNKKPLGTETERCDDIYVKTERGWVTKRTAVYEEVYGPIPSGYKVLNVYLDKDDISIENLRSVDNYVITVLMANDWLGKGPEIFDAGAKYAELKRALKGG